VNTASVPAAASRTEAAPASAAPLAWPRADLLRRLHQALALAPRALAAALAQDERGSQPAGLAPATNDRPASGRPLQLAKVVAEAAMLLRCAAFLRAEDASLGAAIDAVASLLAPHARAPSVLVQLCREPARAIEHAAAHVYLSDLGQRDETFDRFLQETLAGARVGSPERLPNHALECHWLDQIRSGRVEEAAIDPALLANTCVASQLDVLGCSTLDLYAFTHVVLYATDMGRRSVRWPRPVDEIVAGAQASLAAALDADNFDLAAELLWTWPMLRVPWDATASFAFEVLASVQDEHRFLPGPEYSPCDLATHSPAQRDEAMFRTSYHATFVMGMLCAVALRRGCAPSQRSADAPANAGATDELLQLMAPSSREPRWLQELALADRPRRDALAPFVLSIVLRRSAANHAIDRLRSALEAGLQRDWADGPSARQALGLLRRVTSLARLRATAG